ncbi:tRNA adenosine(34) deaminase TadA [Halomonas sabkhae]|uniref:tRNA adenosine(34) deaminase TadA n=1 Tax=Halomonas sabkhae TaxID=626223 RepID=UPI0025B5F055|nr:tRNA adenosine(34) deaminase TadA [Halomonas sabkhae]MDN3526234.1 tRNA adenosine(34) deaminase TadA [Halomonas sabkhae]
MRSDEYYMHRAMDQARRAEQAGEVPVGAVVVDAAGDIIGEGYNAPVSTHDPSAHAEVRALRDAGARVGNYRLEGCRLFVTLEPCLMCTGAIIHARLAGVVYGAAEPRSGMVESRANLFAQPWYNHRVEVTGGVLSARISRQLKGFFHQRREGQPASDDSTG